MRCNSLYLCKCFFKNHIYKKCIEKRFGKFMTSIPQRTIQIVVGSQETLFLRWVFICYYSCGHFFHPKQPIFWLLRFLLFLLVSPIEILEQDVGCIYVCRAIKKAEKMLVLPSADKSRPNRFILSKNIYFSSKQPSLTADGHTIMNLPCLTRAIFHLNLHT
jgi:hypothetical protein